MASSSSNEDATSVGKDPEIQSQPDSSQNCTSISSIEIPGMPNLGYSSSSVNIHSFSKLLEEVEMAASSRRLQYVIAPTNPHHPSVQNALIFKGKYEISHQEALESVTVKAARSKVEAQAQALPELPTPASPTIIDKELTLYQADKAHDGTTTQGVNHIGKYCSKHFIEPQAWALPEPPIIASSTIMDNQLVLYEDDKANAGTAPQGVNQIGKCFSNRLIEPPYTSSLKSTNSDGYKWRKYGQKQVKSSENYRSYYRCTFIGCRAKKTILHSDVPHSIVDVVYKGEHNHDPPPQIRGRSIGMKKRASFGGVSTENEKDVGSAPERLSAVSVLPDCGKKQHEPAASSSQEIALKRMNGLEGDANGGEVGNQNVQKSDLTQGLETNKGVLVPQEVHSVSDDSSGRPGTDTNMKEHEGTSKQKKRLTDRDKASPDPMRKALKHPKVVVHAAGDVGISCDGYRWRKYGQKMVKGNPQPRSYYRCTSAGCAVRKQVERATDNSAAIIVTYEGKHDHDMPLPKKPQISASNNKNDPGHLVAAANENSARSQETETLSSSSLDQQLPSTSQLSGDVSKEDMKVEKTLVDANPSDQRGSSEKLIESATTLLSMGIELKSC